MIMPRPQYPRGQRPKRCARQLELAIMRNTFGAEQAKDPLLLVSRLLMMLLFIIFGWKKLIGFGGTVGYFTHLGLPLPVLAAAIALVMEFFVGIAIVLGLFTRPLAILLAIYTFATALIGHPFWDMAGADQVANEINFFKNVSIVAGLFVLYLTGAGRFSIDHKLGLD